MKVLLTGGLGYIGSHTAVEALNAGYEVIIVDNLSNSKIEVIDKIKQITGKDFLFYKADVCNKEAMQQIFEENSNIFAVIHFAGYKSVNESVYAPLKYYENNLDSTFNILHMMQRFDCKNLIFSSSASVYSMDNEMPVDENGKLDPISPYGRTKHINEIILRDFQTANPDFDVTILRYFNPVGAHESGLIGEDPFGIPTNVMPCICRAAVGEVDLFQIFGNDYNTKDGTCVRDYIHVVDLAIGHIKALDRICKNFGDGFKVYNLGTGIGYSVLEILNAFNRANGDLVKYTFAPRRKGDVEANYASVEKAEKELGFKATRTLEEMCRSSYLFKINNSNKN